MYNYALSSIVDEYRALLTEDELQSATYRYFKRLNLWSTTIAKEKGASFFCKNEKMMITKVVEEWKISTINCIDDAYKISIIPGDLHFGKFGLGAADIEYVSLCYV